MLTKIANFFSAHIANPMAQEQDPGHALQAATVVLLVEMMQVDGDVNPQEQAALQQIVHQHFSLSEQETAELVAFAETELQDAACAQYFTRRLNELLSQQDKILLIRYLWQIAYADGRLDKYEEHYVRQIAELLYVSHTAYIKMKLEVEQEIQAP